MISVERSRKRPRSNSNYSDFPVKRTVIDCKAVPPWPEQQASEATIPLLPGKGIPRAPSQSHPFDHQRTPFYLSTQQPERTLGPLSPTFWTLLPENHPQLPASGCQALLTDNLLQTTTMYGQADVCLPNGCFDFARPTHQWVDWFPGLVPSRQASTNQLSLGKYRDSTEDVDNSGLVSEKTCISDSGTDPYEVEPYFDHPSGQMPGLVQDGQVFACDNNAYFPSWQSNYLAPRPLSMETRQPSANPQHMIYHKGTTNQVENPSGHEAHVDADADDDVLVNRRPTAQTFYPNGRDLQAPKHQCSKDSELANCAVARSESSPSRRGPFKNPDDRTQTAQTRRNKACIRCRMQKIRCLPDPSNPRGGCLTCQKVMTPKFSLQCVRYKITEIKLFKPGQVPGLEWTNRWLDKKLTNIHEWKSSETRSILTTEGFSSSPLELEVREFVPLKGDVLERHWYIPGGLRKSVKVPCFAIADVNVARKSYVDYINRGGAEVFKGWLKKRDELLNKTYGAAIETSINPNTSVEERELLKMVLQLWVAIRITTRSIRIRGGETLGMPSDIFDETSPLHGEIPIPPVMGAQIELILIQGIQIPLRKQVLDKLQHLMRENKPSTWFTRYLCLFILLHNCAMITKYDAGYAKKYIPQRKYARPREVEDYHTGANVLLAHWHYCNKGSQPFALGNSATDFPAVSELNNYQTSFVKEAGDLVRSNEKTWKSLQQDRAYEHDYYFVSQLFEPNWKPRSSMII